MPSARTPNSYSILASKDVLVGFGDIVRVGDVVDISDVDITSSKNISRGLILDFKKNSIMCGRPTGKITFIDSNGSVSTLSLYGGSGSNGWRREFEQVTGGRKSSFIERVTKFSMYRKYMEQNGYIDAQNYILNWTKQFNDLIEVVYFIKTSKLSIILAVKNIEKIQDEVSKLLIEIKEKFLSMRFEINIVHRKMAFALMEEFDNMMDAHVVKDILNKPRFFFPTFNGFPRCVIDSEIRFAKMPDDTCKKIKPEKSALHTTLADFFLEFQKGDYFEVDEYGNKL